MIRKTILWKLLIFLLFCFFFFSCAGDRNVLKSVENKENGVNLSFLKTDIVGSKYSVLVNSDERVKNVLKGDDGLIYKDLVYFDVYIRATKINYSDNIFVIIPARWERLYADTGGIYLNYVPLKVETK